MIPAPTPWSRSSTASGSAWTTFFSVTKSTALYPNGTPRSRPNLVTESETFVDQVFWSDGGLATLLTAPYSYMNGNVAKHYGLTVPPESAATFTRVEFGPDPAGGHLDSAPSSPAGAGPADVADPARPLRALAAPV